MSKRLRHEHKDPIKALKSVQETLQDCDRINNIQVGIEAISVLEQQLQAQTELLDEAEYILENIVSKKRIDALAVRIRELRGE